MNGKDCLLAFASLEKQALAAEKDTGKIRQSFRQQKKRRVQLLCAVSGCLFLAVVFAGLIPRRPPATLPPAAETENIRPSESSTVRAPAVDPETDVDPETGVAGTLPTATGTPARNEEPATQNTAEIAVIPHWEEKSMPEKYTGLEFGDTEYRVGRNAIAPDCLGEASGTAILIGFDVYTNAVYRVPTAVYALKDIAPACAVGVRFETGECRAYVNPSYRPATLSQFIRDLNLKNELRCGNAYMDYHDGDRTYHALTFADFDDALVWDLLLNEDLPLQDTEEYQWSKQLFSVAVSVPALGYTNQGLWATENGWVVTNLLETAKAFYIGSARTRAFADALLAGVPYTETVGVQEGETGIPE